jgi:hypothetical protein
MWRDAWVWGLSVSLAASVLGASLVLAQDTPPRLRGTLDQVNGNALAIKARSGTSSTVQLKGDAPVVAVEKGAMSDIKDNSFVGINGRGCERGPFARPVSAPVAISQFSPRWLRTSSSVASTCAIHPMVSNIV